MATKDWAGVTSGIDRRALVKGAAGAALAAGALGSAGTAWAGETADAEGFSAEAGTEADIEAFEAARAPIAPVEPPASYDYEADVVIVGGGGGGVSAALRLAEAGLDVAIVEKTGILGGETRFVLYLVNAGGNQVTERYQYAQPSYPYDVDAIVEYLMQLYGNTADPELLRAIYTESPKMVDWVIDNYGGDFDALGRMAEGAGMLYWNYDVQDMDPVDMDGAPGKKRGWAPWFDGIQENVFPKLGVDVHLNTEARALVMEDGAVVGVKAVCDDGELYFHGRKAVLLTSGDFASNRALFKKYLPSADPNMAIVPGWGHNDGMALRMALGAGAAVAGIDCLYMTDNDIRWQTADEYSTQMTCVSPYLGQTVAAQPWMRVNSLGQRMPYGMLAGTQWMIGNSDTFACFDDKWRELIPQNYFATRGPVYAVSMSEQFQELVDQGVVKCADTIEELEEKLGLNPGVLSGNVEKWNVACEAGEDYAPANKYPAEYLVPIDTPPYYGVGVGASLWGIKCGVRINPQMQVISTESKVIPGLYAGFHTAGGQCGAMTNGNGGSLLAQGNMTLTGGYMAANAILANE